MKKRAIIYKKHKTENADVGAMRGSNGGRYGAKERSDDTQKYLQSCQTEFWQKSFHVELDYLLQHLGESRDANDAVLYIIRGTRKP